MLYSEGVNFCSNSSLLLAIIVLDATGAPNDCSSVIDARGTLHKAIQYFFNIDFQRNSDLNIFQLVFQEVIIGNDTCTLSEILGQGESDTVEGGRYHPCLCPLKFVRKRNWGIKLIRKMN
jgi:hypothetical protein